MGRKPIIPSDLLITRSIKESAIREESKTTEISSSKVIDSIKDKNIDHKPIVSEFFRECEFVNTENKIHECVSILSESAKNDEEKEPGKFITNMGNFFVNKIIPNTVNYNKAREDIKRLKEVSNNLYSLAEEKISENEELSRVISNHNKISKRFTLNSYNECNYNTVEDVAEHICESVNTYDMPVHKKVNIALEEGIYNYAKNGVELDKPKYVKSVVEYFYNDDFLTDKDCEKIKKVLDTNRFISDEDITSVSNIYNSESYSDKVYSLYKLYNYFDDLANNIFKEISSCGSSYEEIDLVVNRAIGYIYTAGVSLGKLSLDNVEKIWAAIMAIPIITGCKISTFFNCVNKAIEDKKVVLPDQEDIDLESKLEQAKVINKTKNFCKEVADIIDQAVDDDTSKEVIHEPENDSMNEYAFLMSQNILAESKDFADSEDVKDICKKYKAEQNKNASKLKKAIQKIYTKSPEAIIDELPSIFELIRVFGILALVAIPSVGPVIALVTFITDRFIQMKVRKEDSGKLLNYFKKEKDKVEKKIDKLSDGAKKERMEEYYGALEKSIEKLQENYDKLRTEEELDKENGYLESAKSIDMLNPTSYSINTFFSVYMNDVITMAIRASELLKNKILNSLAYPTVTFYDIDYIKEINERTFFINNFVRPDGFIEIPIACLKNLSDPVVGIEIYADLNKYISDSYMFRSFVVEGNTYITLLCSAKIDIQYDECKDIAFTQEGKVYTSNLLALSEAVDALGSEEIGYNTINKGLIECIDSLANDDLRTLTNVIVNSSIDSAEFVDSLKDYEYDCDDYRICGELKYCINALENAVLNENNLGNTLLSLESCKVLRSIIELGKMGEQKPVTKVKENIKSKVDAEKKKVKETKDKISSKSKEVTGNIANKTKDGKIAMTTNVKLAAEAMKKKVQNLGTKEKEISTTIDAATSSFTKGIEKSLTNDRREAIIKGSIIPSFSKMIKAGIAAGATYAVNPVLCAIGCIGGLAASKALNKKERQMLLEEIDVELQVVESEIDRAKDSDPKRYKQLLMYQRKLMREQQRIRYNVKLYAKDKSSLMEPDV